MSTSRADLAVPLLLQSPPGQVNNVYEDVFGLITCEEDAGPTDQKEFEQKAQLAREEHNVEQLIVVDLPDNKGKAILSKSSVHIGQSNRFIAPRHKISFKVDHSTLKTSDAKPYKENKEAEPLREELEKQLSTYVADRYATGVVEVVAVPLPRKIIPVQEEIIKEAKSVENTLVPGEGVGAVSTGVEDAEMTPKESENENVETKEDDLEAEPKDDPVQAVEDARAVEEDNAKKSEEGDEKEEKEQEETKTKEPSSSANQQELEPVEKEDEETSGETKIVIHIVANKYKLSNFWSGRWRSTYTLASSDANEVEANTSVHIHYFEDGNVQLHTNKSVTLNVQHSASTSSYTSSIVKAIEKFEEEYQQELFKHSSNLSEGAFRALRRQLPMTRQKIDWDKVLNYKLGNELSKH